MRRSRDLCRLPLDRPEHQERMLRAYWAGRSGAFGLKRWLYRLARGREVTQPELLAAALARHAPAARVVVLESGGQSSWLQRELSAAGVPAVIVDARRAKAALSCRLNKTDANDAAGLAQLARTGWELKGQYTYLATGFGGKQRNAGR